MTNEEFGKVLEEVGDRVIDVLPDLDDQQLRLMLTMLLQLHTLGTGVLGSRINFDVKELRGEFLGLDLQKLGLLMTAHYTDRMRKLGLLEKIDEALREGIAADLKEAALAAAKREGFN